MSNYAWFMSFLMVLCISVVIGDYFSDLTDIEKAKAGLQECVTDRYKVVWQRECSHDRL